MTVVTIVFEALWDAVLDTLGLVPFLFATYLAMEAIEHAGMGITQRLVSKAGAAGPIVGAFLGVVPQCGFSAMAATLYSVCVLTAGTLVAVMLSTSDEMLPVFVANGAPVALIVQILGLKIVVGLIAGLLVDLAVRVWRGPAALARPVAIAPFCEREGCHCEFAEEGDVSCHHGAEGSCGACERGGLQITRDDPGHTHACEPVGESGLVQAQGSVSLAAQEPVRIPSPITGHAHTHSHALDHDHTHTHSHDHGSGASLWRSIAWSACVHTAKVTFFLLVITFGLDLILDFIGDDVLATFLIEHPSSAVVAAGFVGLIPNCAASVIISELYMEGALGAGALISGLLVGSGVTPLVLFRADRHPKRDIAIMAMVLLAGLCVGFLVNAAGFSFSA